MLSVPDQRAQTHLTRWDLPSDMGHPYKILHLITSVGLGGAQMMLYRLLAHTDRRIFSPEVISLLEIGRLGEQIRALGVPVHSLNMRAGVANPACVVRLVRHVRRARPNLVQTWMYHSDLLGGLAGRLARVPVVWGVHQSDVSPGGHPALTRRTMQVCRRLSHWFPERIVCCSRVASDAHVAFGYAADKMIVIPNGFDLLTFRSDLAARRGVRQELGIPESAPLIGLVARFHAQKDHHNFFAAASKLHACRPDAHWLLCGDQVTWNNPRLVQWIEKAGVRDTCHLLGSRNDIARITAALDVASSSSCSGEAFPMAVGEAMACGVPCVVTDVGDCRYMVAQTGRVVPPKNPIALANAWREILELDAEPRRKLGEGARQRVAEHFNVETIARHYGTLYLSVLEQQERRLAS